MTTPNQNAGTAAVDAVLGALDRLAADLRHRTEEAEGRAAEVERRLEREREGRLEAEARAAASERAVQDALRRAEAAEAAMRENVEQLRRDLLGAVQEVATLVQARAATPPPARPDRPAGEPDDPYQARRERVLAHIPDPAAGRAAGADQPSPRRWSREERGYAWVEDEPGPPWWRRIFGRHY